MSSFSVFILVLYALQIFVFKERNNKNQVGTQCVPFLIKVQRK